MKILLLKPSSLGDVVQALPILRLLKQHFPQGQIYWWIESGLAPLLEGDPDLAGLVLFNRHGWTAPQNWGRFWHSIHWMRQQEFDWVIDLQSLMRSGVVAWLANGKLTIGLDEPREGARGFYDIIVQRPSYYTHAVDWYLEVLKRLDVPVHQNFDWLPKRSEVAAGLRQKWPLNGDRWMILQPGARWTNKRWPVEYYATLVRELASTYRQHRFAVLGGSEDAPLGRQIAEAEPQRCLDLTGKLTLPEMVEWIRVSELMVTNDTGPMHVAAALRKPVVVLFGPTEPRRTGPYGQLDHVLQTPLPCVPCMRPRCTYIKPLECLRSLTPSLVADAVKRQL